MSYKYLLTARYICQILTQLFAQGVSTLKVFVAAVYNGVSLNFPSSNKLFEESFVNEENCYKSLFHIKIGTYRFLKIYN